MIIGYLICLAISLTVGDRSSGIVTSAIRFATLFTISVISNPTLLNVTARIWSSIEPGAYFIAATLPSLRPLVSLWCKWLDFGNHYTCYIGDKTSDETIAPQQRQSASEIWLSLLKAKQNNLGSSPGDWNGFAELAAEEDSIHGKGPQG